MASLSGAATAPKRRVEWAVSAVALPGQAESGDLHFVRDLRQRAVLAVVDGLGHGDEAAVAARVAVAALERSPDEPVAALLMRCHEELKKTRGVALSLASVDVTDGTLTWLGVGNVAGVLIHAAGGDREGLITRGGVVGFNLPPLRSVTLPVARGDTLILATDGIRSSFTDDLSLGGTPQRIAQETLDRHWRGTDDALVLVARYLGASS
jgi:serine phosphatase RsbU (regulator of sigma subunit)